MSDETTIEQSKGEQVPAERGNALVVRSVVPAELNYPEYRPHLRVDFFHSCAYCTIAEAEAMAIRFTIDHYEPQEARKDLVNEYGNLMYCCDTCNQYKGDRCPPEEARQKGYRFFRPDQDLRTDHFERKGRELSHKSNTGYFTIETLDLNRENLKRLRDLRERLKDCDRYVVEGIMALRSFKIDELPREVRAKAIEKIKDAQLAADEIGEAIDELLREHSRSPFIDPDLGAAHRAVERTKALKDLEGLYPGRWRAPRKRRSRGSRK